MTLYNSIKYKHNYFTSFVSSDYYKFYIGQYLCGYVTKVNFSIILQYFKNDFEIINDSIILNLQNISLELKQNSGIKLSNTIDKNNDFENYSEFFVQILNKLACENKIVAKGEAMLVLSLVDKQPICKIDRSLLAFFGLLAQGIHVNGYVIKDNQKCVWLSKRANTVVEANKYDNLVGGAISYGYTILDTLKKESLEEANIANNLSQQSVFKKSLCYRLEKNNGIRNDIVYIFDLQLPIDYIPVVNDGEVEKFFLLSLEELKTYLIDWNNFKFNSWLVAAYFLLNNFNNISNEEKKALDIIYQDLNNNDIINLE